MNSQEASIRNLENQVGHLASAINNRPQGFLPSDTEINPKREGKEHCKAVTLRSGKELHEVVGGTPKRPHGEDSDTKKKSSKYGERENKKLGLKEAKPTNVTLQLADMSIIYPRGIVEDVLVKVNKFIFPVDFIILDFEEDREIPIILGRPSLAIGRTLIDVQKDELIMRVQDQEVTFNVFKATKFPSDSDEFYRVDLVEGAVNDVFVGRCISVPLKNTKLYKEKTKRWLDKRIIERKFVPSQTVLLYNSRLKWFPGKLKLRWSEPFIITKVFSYGAV